MKGRLENILAKKLRGLDSAQGVPTWAEMESRLREASSTARAGLTPLVSPPRWMTWRRAASCAAAILITLGMGTGIYQLNKQNQINHLSIADSITETLRPLPGIENAITTDNIEESIIENQAITSLSTLFASARSVQPVNHPTAKTTAQLLEKIASITPESTAINRLTAEGLYNEIEEDSHQTPNNTYALSSIADPSNGSEQASSYPYSNTPNFFDQYSNWRHATNHTSRSWMVSAFSNAFASNSSASDAGYYIAGRSATALKETNFSENQASQVGEELTHHFPVSVGIAARKYLTKRLAIESGLTYTYLHSSVTLSGTYDYKYRQQVHYLGIPLNLNYSLISSKRWELYAMGGGMMEFALSAKYKTDIYYQGERTNTTSEDISAKGVLWSTNLGIGAGYDLTDQWSIYFEPGASYYFSNVNQPYTYRTAHPWGFNARMGFRVKF